MEHTVSMYEPTAAEIWEYVGHGAFYGEESGRTEAPTGAFAKVFWPWSNVWYLVDQDDRGNSTIVTKGMESVRLKYEHMGRKYSAWEAQEEAEEHAGYGPPGVHKGPFADNH